jgi:hypothetical protein
LVVHPKKKKKKKKSNNNSGGPDLTLNKLFWEFSLLLRQKACRPKKNTTPRGVHCIA